MRNAGAPEKSMPKLILLYSGKILQDEQPYEGNLSPSPIASSAAGLMVGIPLHELGAANKRIGCRAYHCPPCLVPMPAASFIFCTQTQLCPEIHFAPPIHRRQFSTPLHISVVNNTVMAFLPSLPQNNVVGLGNHRPVYSIIFA